MTEIGLPESSLNLNALSDYFFLLFRYFLLPFPAAQVLTSLARLNLNSVAQTGVDLGIYYLLLALYICVCVYVHMYICILFEIVSLGVPGPEYLLS